MRPNAYLILPSILFALFAGCNNDSNSGNFTPTEPSPAAENRPKTIRLLIVDDPALAKEISRVRGEWAARSSTTLEISELTSAQLKSQLSSAKQLDGEAIIYPAGELGTLAEAHLIQPIPEAWMNRPAVAKNDLFELPGLRETSWREKPFGLTLGSPVLVCVYRPDLFARFDRQPPATWADYQQLVEFFGNRANLTARESKAATDPAPKIPETWSGTLEPLAPGSAGFVFLARAAAYAKHPDDNATLFDRHTMEPRITAPPFVRALTQLVATATAAGDAKTQLQQTPASARRDFFAGQAAMALTWPTAAEAVAAQAGHEPIAVAFVELPGSPEMYSQREQQWQQRSTNLSPHVPLLGTAGRMASLVSSSAELESGSNQANSKRTKSAETAFDLLVWLTTKPWDRQICSASPATTLFRRSQMANAARWVEAEVDSVAARQYGDIVAHTSSRAQWLAAPRIPGRAEYIAALDEAVRRAVLGELSPEKALATAADRWREITKAQGLAEQREAYARSLGFEP